jgi:hypothetical protein
MTSIHYLNSPIPEHLVSGAVTNLLGYESEVTALRPWAADSSFFVTSKLLPAQRRKAMQALHAFCREVRGSRTARGRVR